MLMATTFLQNIALIYKLLTRHIPYLFVIGIVTSDTFCGLNRVFQVAVRGGGKFLFSGAGGIIHFIGGNIFTW